MAEAWHGHCPKMNRRHTPISTPESSMSTPVRIRNKKGSIVTAGLLVWTLLFPTLAFGQTPGRTDLAKPESPAVDNTDYSAYLLQIPVTSEMGDSYSREAKAIAQIL